MPMFVNDTGVTIPSSRHVALGDGFGSSATTSTATARAVSPSRVRRLVKNSVVPNDAPMVLTGGVTVNVTAAGVRPNVVEALSHFGRPVTIQFVVRSAVTLTMNVVGGS